MLSSVFVVTLRGISLLLVGFCLFSLSTLYLHFSPFFVRAGRTYAPRLLGFLVVLWGRGRGGRVSRLGSKPWVHVCICVGRRRASFDVDKRGASLSTARALFGDSVVYNGIRTGTPEKVDIYTYRTGLLSFSSVGAGGSGGAVGM